MKRTANDKAKHNNRTGAALRKLTPVDELMMDYEGRESVYMVGLQNPDNAPVLPNQDNNDNSNEFTDDTMSQVVYSEEPASAPILIRVPVANPPQPASLSLPGKFFTLIFFLMVIFRIFIL